MTTNTNPDTGIAFGYVAAADLDPDIVHELMYGRQAKYLTEDRAREEEIARQRAEFDEALAIVAKYAGVDHVGQFEPCLDNFESGIEEPEVVGTYQDVLYTSSWLGGALNFFIMRSPHITNYAHQASPCVPGCGILKPLNEGNVTCYDVPADWYFSEGA
jgi:hypothetical protein